MKFEEMNYVPLNIKTGLLCGLLFESTNGELIQELVGLLYN